MKTGYEVNLKLSKAWDESSEIAIINKALLDARNEGRSELTDITHRNYEATKRMGQITLHTTQEDFVIKLKEEVQELYEADPSDWSELADITLVCFAMAEHYGIDLLDEIRKKTEFNEKRED